MNSLPILYSFRRCPYAMRARMALWIAGITCELREVKLADKPAEMLAASAKGTVPVLVDTGGEVIDESIQIMRWALNQNDPEDWLSGDDHDLLEQVDGPFKHHLDRYKYWTRYDSNPQEHRAAALEILRGLDERLSEQAQLCRSSRSLADMASFPFIRQFANHDRAWFDLQDVQHLQSWLAGHLKSEIFARIMVQHPPWKADDPITLFAP